MKTPRMECPLTVTGISTEDERRMRHTSLVSCTVVMQGQVLVVQTVHKTVEVSQFSILIEWLMGQLCCNDKCL